MCLVAAAPAEAQIYSWRDASGHLVLSNKPSRVLEIIELKTARPRSLGDRELDTHRQKLIRLFRSLEQQPAPRKETAA